MSELAAEVADDDDDVVHAGTGGVSDNSGGGIHSWDNAIVTITKSTVSGNTVAAGIGGGGIANRGTLTMTNSTVSGNSATAGPGGPGFAGGIVSGVYVAGVLTGALTIADSTVSGNSAVAGAGVFLYGDH